MSFELLKMEKIENNIIIGDCLEVLKTLPDGCCDLIFGSPPYEDCRTYGIDVNLKGQDWVDWMMEVYKESIRVCKGLVAFVVEGRTRNFKWSATPVLLMADLHRAGYKLRKPPLYQRHGIPGSGGPDWLANKYEFIVCVADGKRANTSRYGKNGLKPYAMPNLSNPGNIIDCGCVGGGHLGSDLAHDNEAPFPEKLAEFFVRSFCLQGGIVLDPFAGSGTVAAVAIKTGRKYFCIDTRQSQIELIKRRIAEANGTEYPERLAETK